MEVKGVVRSELTFLLVWIMCLVIFYTVYMTALSKHDYQ